MKASFPFGWHWALMAAAAFTGAACADSPKFAKIEVEPKTIELKGPFAYRQLLITGLTLAGDRVDLTRQAHIEAPTFLKVTANGQVRPSADGVGALTFKVAGLSGSVPAHVMGQKENYQVSFTRDVMPALSRLGCNAGTCHGSAQGKNGFQLSLRGYDPLFDHRALVDDISGRRFNRAAPERSLMLLKPAGAVAHVGGVLMQPGEPSYELIRAWITQGVKLDLDAPRVIKIEIQPEHPVLPVIGSEQQMSVLATYSDGSRRDVTAESFLVSSNTEVATAD